MCVPFVNILAPLLQATELEQEPLKLNQCIGCELPPIFIPSLQSFCAIASQRVKVVGFHFFLKRLKQAEVYRAVTPL